MKGNPAVPGGPSTSKPTWSHTSGCSTTSAFFRGGTVRSQSAGCSGRDQDSKRRNGPRPLDRARTCKGVVHASRLASGKVAGVTPGRQGYVVRFGCRRFCAEIRGNGRAADRRPGLRQRARGPLPAQPARRAQPAQGESSSRPSVTASASQDPSQRHTRPDPQRLQPLPRSDRHLSLRRPCR